MKIVKNKDFSDIKHIISEIKRHTNVDVTKNTDSQDESILNVRKLYMLIATATTFHNQEDIAYFIGKDRSTLSNFLNNNKDSFIFNNEKLMLIYDQIVNNKSVKDLLMNYKRKVNDSLKEMMSVVNQMKATNKTIELKKLIKKTKEHDI